MFPLRSLVALRGGFFSSVGLAVHQALPNEQTPTLLLKAHEFIFFPTKVSFDQEQIVYQTAVQKQNRSLLEQLSYTYPAGYFSKAAQNYLQRGALGPVTPVIPTAPAEIQITPAGARLSRQAFPRHVIDDVEDTEAPAASELVVDEVERPSGIWPDFDENRRAGSHCTLPRFHGIVVGVSGAAK